MDVAARAARLGLVSAYGGPLALASLSTLMDPATLERVQHLLQQGRRAVFRRGEVLVGPGLPPSVYYIASGCIKITTPPRGAHPERTVGLLGQGAVVGEISLLAGLGQVPARATAVARTEAYAWERHDLAALLGQHLEVATYLLHWLSLKALALFGQAVALRCRPAEQRVLGCLASLALAFGAATAGGAVRIPFHLPRRDLASLAGVSRVTLHRVLASLRLRGLVAEERRHLVVRDVQALVAALEGPAPAQGDRPARSRR